MDGLKFSNDVTFRIKDVSLERLWGIVFTFCEMYSDYSFNIVRYPKYYILTFKTVGDGVEWGFNTA